MRDLQFQAREKCQQCPGRKGSKGKAGGKGDMADQGKSGYGYRKGKYANQWQADMAKGAKPTKGKGKYGNQWAHQDAQEVWYEEQGTKNGGGRTGWMPNTTHQGQLQGQNAQAIQGVAPPNQRDKEGVAHPDAFVRPNQRGAANQVHTAPPTVGQEQHAVGVDGHGAPTPSPRFQT